MTDTDTSEAPSRPDDMPEMVPSADDRLHEAWNRGPSWDTDWSGLEEVVWTAYRDGFTAKALVERLRTPEPSVSARDQARKAIAKVISPQRWSNLNAGEESRELAEAELLLAAAITSAKTAAREAAIQECVNLCVDIEQGATGLSTGPSATRITARLLRDRISLLNKSP